MLNPKDNSKAKAAAANKKPHFPLKLYMVSQVSSLEGLGLLIFSDQKKAGSVNISKSRIPSGKALVVIDEDALISPDHRARVVKQFYQNKQSTFLSNDFRNKIGTGTVGAIVLSIVFSFFGMAEIAILSAIVAVGLAGFGFFTRNHPDKLREQSKDLLLPCPLCHNKINLVDPWMCGNCKHEHNADEKEDLAIPFLQCLHSACHHQEQTAFQCPHCHYHIVLDKSRYVADRSYEAPYRYVARYSSDTSAPIPHRPKASGTSSSAFDDDGSVFDD